MSLTDAELLVLGLVAERPRHGYELEREIERRGMRQWTQIGFSSIYYVLGKLERDGLVAAGETDGAKTRKVFTLTPTGRDILVSQTVTALKEYRPVYPSILLGILHLPVLERDETLNALESREESITSEVARLRGIQVDQQPLPDHVEALFDYAIGQLLAESDWISRTLAYLKTKPWID